MSYKKYVIHILSFLFTFLFFTATVSAWCTETKSGNTMNVVCTNYTGTKTVQCSNYTWVAKINLTVNGVTDTLTCDSSWPKWTVSYSPTWWTKGSVTITVACSDPSGCQQSKYYKTVTSNGSGRIYIYDTLWNSSTILYNVQNIDKTAPNGSTSKSPSYGWTKSVRVTASCSDSQSGCTSSSYSKTVTSNGNGSITISDRAGNTRNLSYSISNIDRTAPSWSVSYSTTAWTKGSVTITVTCSDSQSGCTQSKYYKTVSGNGSGFITISDRVWNSRNVSYSVTNIDKTAPTWSVSYSPSWWTNGSVKITVSCSDSQSGCQQSTYSKTVSSNGSGLITIYDRLGNSKNVSYNVTKIDKTSPTWSVSYSPSWWTNGSVTITVTCSDNASWCTSSTYTKTVWSNGSGTIPIYDRAWNSRSVAYSVSKIDKTVPTVSLSCNDSSGQSSTTVSCSASMSNLWASPDTLMYSNTTQWWVLPTGNVNTSSKTVSYNYTNNGTYTVSVQAKDSAGNISTKSSKTFKIDTSAPSINSNTNLSKWYNSSNLPNLSFTLKDQRSSTVSSEEVWLKSIKATFNGSNIAVSWFQQTNGTTSITISVAKSNLLSNIQQKSTNIFSIELTDKVWHVTKANYYVKYDNTKPTLSILDKVSSRKNSNIWISLTTSDALSGLQYSKYVWDDAAWCVSKWTNYSNGATIYLSQEGTHTLYICNRDLAGNTNTTSYGTYKLDKTDPKLDVSNKDYNWKKSDISIILTSTDTISGIQYSKYIWDNATGCASSWTSFTNGSAISLTQQWEHTLYLCNSDKAGNTVVSSYGPYKLDKTKPTLSIVNKISTWRNTDIWIQLTTADSLSGLLYSKYIWDNSSTCSTDGFAYSNNDIIYLEQEGAHTLYICNSDVAWNQATTNYGTYKLDKTKQELDVSNTWSVLWTNTGVLVDLYTSDLLSWVDIDFSKYIVNNSSLYTTTCETNGTLFWSGQTINVKDPGINYIHMCGQDIATNVHSNTFGPYKIDTESPSLNVSNKDYNWKNSDILIKLFSSDDKSGVKYSKYIWDNASACHSSGTNFFYDDSIYLSQEGQHTLYLCAQDNAWNKSLTSFGTYKLDKTDPTLNVSNKDYAWKSANINLWLTWVDSRSGLNYARYIWFTKDGWLGNYTACHTSGDAYSNNQNITLDYDGEYILVLCAKDVAGNIANASYGPYRLDKTQPNILWSYVTTDGLADNFNFEAIIRWYDNLNGGSFQWTYTDYARDYTYTITAGSDTITGSGVINAWETRLEVFHDITDATPQWWKYNIAFTITDKAGNTVTDSKDFVIYPNLIDSATISPETTQVVYANNDDAFNYSVTLKDKHNNEIYGKQVFSILHEDDGTTWFNVIELDGSNALSDTWLWVTDKDGVLNFGIKSLAPWVFTETFKLVFYKWDDSYSDINNFQNISVTTNEYSKKFHRPYVWELNISNNGWVSWDAGPQPGTSQLYRLLVKRKSDEWDIEQFDVNDFTPEISLVDDTNFVITDISSISHPTKYEYYFNVRIDYAPWASAIAVPSAIKVEYPELTYNNSAGNDVVYDLTTSDDPLDTTPIETTTWEAFEWVKIVWIKEWDGKEYFVDEYLGNEESFSTINKAVVRREIEKNIAEIISGIPDGKQWDVVNGVVYVEWRDLRYSQVSSGLWKNDTVVVKDGNFIIDENIDQTLWIVTLKSGYNSTIDYETGWNVYVEKDVTYIDAIIYANGWLISADDNGDPYIQDSGTRTWDLNKQLVMKGTLFSRNTIAGAVYAWWSYFLPWWEETSDFNNAMIYDLNYIRRWNGWWDPNGDDSGNIYNEWYSNPFVILYNPEVQINPPKWFSMN